MAPPTAPPPCRRHARSPRRGRLLACAAVVSAVVLLVACASEVAADGVTTSPNYFAARCQLVDAASSRTSSTAMEIAALAFSSCPEQTKSPSSVWTPAATSGAQLNVYMTTLPDEQLQATLQANTQDTYALVTSISEGVLDTRGNSQQVYFANADPATEMLGLLAYTIATVAPLSIGFVYVNQLQSSSQTTAGSAVYAEFVRRIAALNYSGPVSSYAYQEGSYSATNFQTFVSGLSSSNAAVFLFTPAGSDANTMLAKLLTTSTTNTILMPSWLIATATSQYAASGGATVPAAKVIVSSTNPHPQDTTFSLSMAQFSSDYNDGGGTALVANSADSVAAVAGWLAARTLVASVQPYALWDLPVTQSTYVSGLFQQRTYTIGGEIPLGTYTSSCNVGGRLVILYSLQSMTASGTTYYGLTSTPLYTLRLKSWECHASDVALNITQMVNVGYVQYTGVGENGIFVSTQMRDTIASAQLIVNFTKCPSSSLGGLSSSVWATALSTAPADAVVGAASVGVDAASVSQLLVDPFFMQPTLYQNYSNVAYLTATNEQQWGAVATWAAQATAVPDVYAVLRGTAAATSAMQSTLNRIFRHVGIGLKSTTQLSSTDTLTASALPTSGVVLLAGAIQSDFGTLQSYLRANTGVSAMLMFDDVTQWYGYITSTFQGSQSAAQRLLFVTNLPRWNSRASITSPSSTTSTLSTNFLTVAPQAYLNTPAAMRTYLAMRVLNMLSGEAAVPSSVGLQDVLYTLQTLQVDDLPLGPFQRTGCGYSDAVHAVTCSGVQNGGAGALFLWSLQEMLSTAAPTAGPYVSDLFGYAMPAVNEIPIDVSSTTTTTVLPGPPGGSTTSSTTQAPKSDSGTPERTIVAASVASSGGVVGIAVAGFVVFCCCMGDSRDNRNAPKDGDEPVTLMFTDIESSTALWATAPQAMASAVALHHKMIRQLIVKYKCYEVKTIGDSFMIACTDPFAAVQLARDLQLGFHQANWGSTAIDDAYAATGKLAGGTNPDECDVCPWSGLRVRVGIHRGLAEVRLDEVTKGYDYYGDTVNTAARTESAGCGGQVLCTASVVDALTGEQRDSVPLVELGPHQLRGVAAPIVMHELRTVPGRVFPTKASAAATGANPLAGLLENGDGLCAPGAQGGDTLNVDLDDEVSQAATTSVEPVTEVLDVYFSPYSVQQRIKLLRQTCKYFCLPTPPRRMYPSNEVYLQALILAVATRTSAVLDFRHKQREASVAGSVHEAEENAAMLDVTALEEEPAASRRPSSVFLSGRDLSEGGVVKRRHSVALIRPNSRLRSAESKKSTMVLVLDNGELLTLSEDVAHSLAVTPEHESLQPAVTYFNGAPTVSGGEVNPCFEEGNGLLFRIIDTDAQRWAFYNDTKEFVMHVHFSVGRNSKVEWGPGAVGCVTQAEGTGRYEGELVVQPLATEVLMTGRVNGYSMRYSATLPEDPSGEA